MTTALALLGVMLAGAGAAVIAWWRRAQAVEAQFRPVPGLPGCRVACVLPMTPARFGVALFKARTLLLETGLYSSTAVDRAIASSSNVVSRTMAWTDRAGQRVGGSTEWAGITVASDLSSTFHELLHLVDWRERLEPLDERETWARPGLREADEAFRAWLKNQERDQ